MHGNIGKTSSYAPLKIKLRILTGKGNFNKTPALTESVNMDIWVVSISNQLIMTAVKLKENFQKK